MRGTGSVASSHNPVKYVDPDGREATKKIESSGTGTLKDPFVQKITTSEETDAFKSLSITTYKAYKNNGKTFEHYYTETSFLIKDTEAGYKLASKLNLDGTIGVTVMTTLAGIGIAVTIPVVSLQIAASVILPGLGVYVDYQSLKYESGMKIETFTELNTISDMWGAKNYGYRTTNIYKRPREDSDDKPTVSYTESLSY